MDVVFEKCYSSKPRNISARAVGSSHWPDQFRVEVEELTTWGFKAKVERVDEIDGWTQDDVDLYWKALFG